MLQNIWFVADVWMGVALGRATPNPQGQLIAFAECFLFSKYQIISPPIGRPIKV
jgi:hypothetical protein